MDIVLILNIVTFINLSVLGLILLLKRPVVLHNLVLAYLVFTPAVAVLFNTLLYYDQVSRFSIALFLTFNMNVVWSPLFLFYVLLLTGFTFKFKYSYLLHFIPLLISLSVITPILLMPNASFLAFLAASKVALPWQFNLVNGILAIQCIGYVSISSIVLYRYNKVIKDLFSDVCRISAFWLQEMIIIGFILFLTIFPPIIIYQKLNYFLYFLPLGLNIFYLYTVYKTLSAPVLFTPRVLEVLRLKNEVGNRVKGSKYANEITGRSENFVYESELLKRILVDEKPYLNPELNIKLLSEQSGISVHNLSATINQSFGQNFYDFINGYRIKHAQQILDSFDSADHKIEVLALESGFKTRSVFYSAFKKVTGFTPVEYRKRQKSM